VAAIIQTCLRFKPEQRPSAKEVLALLELVAEMERPPQGGPPAGKHEVLLRARGTAVGVPGASETSDHDVPCGHAGPPPAASTGAAADYRASIEDSARRLHCGSARRRSYDARASVDVRRVGRVVLCRIDVTWFAKCGPVQIAGTEQQPGPVVLPSKEVSDACLGPCRLLS
jgi:hypothetical protein